MILSTNKYLLRIYILHFYALEECVTITLLQDSLKNLQVAGQAYWSIFDDEQPQIQKRIA